MIKFLWINAYVWSFILACALFGATIMLGVVAPFATGNFWLLTLAPLGMALTVAAAFLAVWTVDKSLEA